MSDETTLYREKGERRANPVWRRAQAIGSSGWKITWVVPLAWFVEHSIRDTTSKVISVAGSPGRFERRLVE